MSNVPLSINNYGSNGGCAFCHGNCHIKGGCNICKGNCNKSHIGLLENKGGCATCPEGKSKAKLYDKLLNDYEKKSVPPLEYRIQHIPQDPINKPSLIPIYRKNPIPPGYPFSNIDLNPIRKEL